VSAAKSTVHVESSFAMVVTSGAIVQGFGTSVGIEPDGWLVNVKPTVPSGGVFVPGAASVTRTTQLAGLFAGVEAGQSSVVVVERAVTVMVSFPVLPLWTESAAGMNVPAMV
jgi:hypothetical protein